MDAPPASLEDARNNMVDGQLRPTRVTDKRVLAVMRHLPREAFVPAAARALAYSDVEVPVGSGRCLLPPLTVARMIQAANLSSGNTVLVLGAGYAAAVLAAMGMQVTAIEPEAARLVAAKAAFDSSGVSVATIQAPLAAGWVAGAPYDCIFIDGAVRRLPPLATQLQVAPPGRLCAVLVAAGRSGICVVAERAGTALAQRTIMDCAATPMPGMDEPASFQF